MTSTLRYGLDNGKLIASLFTLPCLPFIQVSDGTPSNPDYSHPCMQPGFGAICSDAIMTGAGGARTGPYP